MPPLIYRVNIHGLRNTNFCVGCYEFCLHKLF